MAIVLTLQLALAWFAIPRIPKRNPTISSTALVSGEPVRPAGITIGHSWRAAAIVSMFVCLILAAVVATTARDAPHAALLAITPRVAP